MDSKEKLSEILSEFARTIAGEFSVRTLVDALVPSIVEILPITGATVSLSSDGAGPRVIAASDDVALRLGWLQSEGRTPSSVAVFTFPLRHSDGPFGALDVYCEASGDLDGDALAVAQTLADVVAAYLLIGQARDQVRTADEFRSNVLRDLLTGLPNRSLLQERLEHASRRAQRSGSSVALVLADLDRFSTINDTYGRAIGDDVLRAVANRLTRLVRPGDTVARSFGDEFIFLCEELHDPVDAEQLAQRVRNAFADPFVVGNITMTLSASVGVAYAASGQDILQQLLIKAHVAMFQTKTHVVDLRDDRAGVASTATITPAVR